MLRKTTWKIVAAVLAVVIAGTAYCIFFAEEKDGTVLYQTGEESAGLVGEASVTGSKSDDTQEESEAAQSTGTSLKNGNGSNPVQADADVKNDSQKLVYVHVCGAVKRPAVYSLPEGSRVCDAIAKAGGMTEDAADDYVNQARFLNDGERVYIHSKAELSDLSVSQYAAGQPVNHTGNGPNGSDAQTGGQERLPVNINTATLSELMTLQGIGESRAESIIAYREAHGAFSKIEDIMKISGIKGAAYEKIKDRICTGNE